MPLLKAAIEASLVPNLIVLNGEALLCVAIAPVIPAKCAEFVFVDLQVHEIFDR